MTAPADRPGAATFNPEPLADYVDVFVIGEGEEVVSEITEVVREWKASGRPEGSRHHVLRWRRSTASTSRRCTTSPTTGAAGRHHPRYPDVPAQIVKRTVADLADWPYQKRQLVPLTEVVHDRLSVEVFRGARGCRFCHRDDHEARAGARRPGADHGPRGAPAHRLRRGEPHLAVDGRRASSGCGRDGGRHGLCGPTTSACRRCGSTPSPWASWPRWPSPALGVDIRPEAGVAPSFRHQQVDHGGGPLRRGRRMQRGVEPDEALLPRPAAHRDRRGHVGHRRAGVGASPSGSGTNRAGHRVRRRIRAEGAHAVPVVRPEHHGGDAAEDPVAAGRHPQGPVCSSSGTTPRPHWSRGWPAGATGASAVSWSAWRGGGTFQEWSEHFDLRRWEEAMAAEGLSMEWYVLRHRDEAEVLPWDHISAGLHKDFLWQDWQGALAEHGLEDCRWTPCYDCGVCTGYGLEHVVASPVAPAGGSQGTGRDLSRGRVVPVDLGVRREPVGVGVTSGRPSGCATRRRARSAGPAIETPPASGSGRCAGRGWPSPPGGFSPRPPRRARPAHGLRVRCRAARRRSGGAARRRGRPSGAALPAPAGVRGDGGRRLGGRRAVAPAGCHLVLGGSSCAR